MQEEVQQLLNSPQPYVKVKSHQMMVLAYQQLTILRKYNLQSHLQVDINMKKATN